MPYRKVQRPSATARPGLGLSAVAQRRAAAETKDCVVPDSVDAQLASAPDTVAPLNVQPERFIVRTLLDSHVAYSPARAVVERWEQLPAWLLDAWTNATDDARGGSGGQDED